MDQPQPCTKCNTLPQDILMLSCSHDLCLNCAAERLNFQMKKRKPADSIVCQFCYQRTPLDAESVAELEKLIPAQQKSIVRSYIDKPVDTIPKTFEKSSRPNEQSNYTQKSTYQKKEDYKPAAREYSLSNSRSQVLAGISSKRTCGEHIDEDILYFCFTCKCECICPQCVIHGKHKDHEVKTIKKSHPIVKTQLQSSIEKIESSIQNLLIRKSQVQKNIRALNQQNSQSKRQIQQAFESIRSKMDIQQRQILSRCDSQLSQAAYQLQKSTKAIIGRIDQLKSYSSVTIDFIKKDEQTMLNFYAKKWKDITDDCREQSTINIATMSLPSNERILGAILDLTQQVDKIAGRREMHEKAGLHRTTLVD